MRLLTTFFLIFLSLPVLASEVERVYTVRHRNIFIGKLFFDHKYEDGLYETHLNGETIGFAKALMLGKLEAAANGTGEEYRQYFPHSAYFDILTLEYQNETRLGFDGGFLRVFSDNLRRESQLDFEQYENAVDPVTAFAYLARPITRDKLCEMRVNVIDGIHVYRLVLRDPENRADGRLQCKGGLERIEGFNDEEIEAKPFYELTAVFQRETEEEFRLDWLVAETEYGTIDIAFHY